jgi:hypothetical protein
VTVPASTESRLPALSAALPSAPEEHVLLRASLLLLLLEEIRETTGTGLERLGYYDFFAANPFLVFSPDDSPARAELHAAGFDERQLSYASTGARFANRRRRLQHDVAFLVAHGLAAPAGTGYAVTPAGREAASRFLSLYAGQYRSAVRLVHGRFKRVSDTALAEQARTLLRQPALLLDLYGSPDPSHADRQPGVRSQDDEPPQAPPGATP